MRSTYNYGYCALCQGDITKGQEIVPRHGTYVHAVCLAEVKGE